MTICIVAGVALMFSADPSKAETRSPIYLNDMRIMACVTAQKAVRARLKGLGRVSFESCASGKFDFTYSDDDREYSVAGHATVDALLGKAGQLQRFFVVINHNPGSYGDWGFEVTNIEIDP